MGREKVTFAKTTAMKKKLSTLRFVQHFFQGVLVLAPIFLTFYVLVWLFEKLDSFIQIKIPALGRPIPGVGVVIILLGVTLVGYLSSSFILGRLFDLFERLLERIPVIKFLYSSLKDVFDALMGEKKKFDHPVLGKIYAEGVWELGFITRNDGTEFGLKDAVAVYVPMSLAISGKVYFIRTDKVRPLNNISAGDAMKFAVSGGVTGGERVEQQAAVSVAAERRERKMS
jgi:uncharacterized membrane protein